MNITTINIIVGSPPPLVNISILSDKDVFSPFLSNNKAKPKSFIHIISS